MLDHLSYSSISAYQLCARSWRYRYVDKVQTPKSPNLAFGSAVHETVEHLIVSRHRGQSADVQATWAEKWAKQQSEDIAWDGELPEEWANNGARILAHPTVQATIDQIVPLVEDNQPVVEKRVELRVPGIDVPIIGFIDLITADGVPCDFKTAARSWTQDQADKEMQVLFYLTALNQAGYTLNPELRFRHIVFVKTKTPQVQVIESRRKPADLFWLFNTIGDVWRGIQAEVFPPNPSAWKCSEKWCEYWHLCRGY